MCRNQSFYLLYLWLFLVVFFYNVEHVLGFLKHSFSIVINENVVDENCPEQRHVSCLLFIILIVLL